MPAVISNTPGHLQQYSQFASQAPCLCMKYKHINEQMVILTFHTLIFQSAKFQTGNTNKPVMDSVNMTSETPIGGFIGSAAPNTNSQGMTTITANVDPIQSKVLIHFQKYTKRESI